MQLKAEQERGIEENLVGPNWKMGFRAKVDTNPMDQFDTVG